MIQCDPIRLIRIRVSECKNINMIKKDKDIADFAQKISRHERLQQQQADLASLG